ncbi:MAG: hypothetical protein ACE5GX_03995 [Thermoanaerobaculia bacterium]
MRSSTTFTLVLVIVLGIAVAPAAARSVRSDDDAPHWCGTDGIHTRLVEAQAKHLYFQQRNAKRAETGRGSKARLMGREAMPEIRKEGKAAVIQDVNSTLVASRNLFDYSNQGVTFTRKKKGFRAKASAGGINPDLGDRIDAADWGRFCTTAPEDDDSFEINLPFKVKYFGKKYKTIFLNSDGNLTFDEADCASTGRTLARVLNGPPRIAALFTDLDPSFRGGESGVYVKLTNNFLRVTWNDVPEWATANHNTAQVTIFKKGKVVMAYGLVEAPEEINDPTASVGVSPGGGSAVELVDLSEVLPVTDTTTQALLELYSLRPTVDDFGVSKAFLDHFKDIYTHVVVFLDFTTSLGGGAFAYHAGVKNQVDGIGRGRFDIARLAGSDGALESFLMMGSLNQYPNDPFQEFLGTNNAMDILGQEAGHRWLAFARVVVDGELSDTDTSSIKVLGRDLSHWSFFFDSDASDMEGNDIMDMGGGMFQTVGATERFSALDQYFMGLRPPEDVPPIFFVKNGSNFQHEQAPSIGRQFVGDRVDITVQNFIDAEGARVPAAGDAPNKFNMAFILLAREGEPARRESIAKVKRFAKEWEKYFKTATDGLGTVKTKLKARRK